MPEMLSQPDLAYRRSADGIWMPCDPVVHRDEEYDPATFDVLLHMQARHFWYRGRHRFLLAAVRRHLCRAGLPRGQRRAVDLGGGCGGWVRYLKEKTPDTFTELALADSSLRALQLAGPVIGPGVDRYQVDLLRLGWTDRWEAVFALDVLEHLPDAPAALRQIRQALAPGGLLFVTLPALQVFWSYYDELVGHQHRYSRRHLAGLAEGSGLRLLESRYFMFFLSPLVLLSRRRLPDLARMTAAEVQEHLAHIHRIPPAPLNALFSLVFAAETPLGLTCPFPWGSSVLGVFQKGAG